MRVLHLAPLWLPIARDTPGGIETFLAALLPALERVGCRVTLCASGDSAVAGTVLPVVARHLCAQMAEGTALEYVFYEQQQLRLALDHAAEFDVVHSHVGAAGFVLSRALDVPVVHTWHGQVYGDLQWLAARDPELVITAPSRHQAERLRQAGLARCPVIPHGLDVAAFPAAPTSSSSTSPGSNVGALIWPPHPQTFGAPRRSRGTPRPCGSFTDTE